MNLYRVIFKTPSGTRTRFVEAYDEDGAKDEIEAEDQVISYVLIELA